MDLYTKKIHFLLSVVSYLRWNHSVTTGDIEQVMVLANMISEKVLGKTIFDTSQGFDVALMDTIHKLEKNGSIILKTYDEVKDLEKSGDFIVGRCKNGGNEFIFVEDPIIEKPSWISLNESIAMEYGTYAAFLGDDPPTLYGVMFANALAWAADVQKERLKKATQKADK